LILRRAFNAIVVTLGVTGCGGVTGPPRGTGACETDHNIRRGFVVVTEFGAKGDGATADQVAINRAIAAGSIVVFPRGTYRLTSAIRPEHDGVTLRGEAGATLLLDPPAPASLDSWPEAILVNRADARLPTHRVVIEGFTIRVRGGPADSAHAAGAIQLNHCVDCVVRQVRIVRDNAATSLPPGIDGIVVAAGSRGALVEGCVVDGLPKAGIYVPPNRADRPATAYVRIVSCEVRNMNGPVGAVGMSVNAENIIVSNVQLHHNAGTGLVVATIGLVPPIGPRHIQVIGGEFNSNGGDGIRLESAYSPVPTQVQITGVSVFGNGRSGIHVAQGSDITITDASVASNGGAGIVLGALPTSAERVRVTNASVFDNGVRSRNAGLVILANSDDISVVGGQFFSTKKKATQDRGIQILPRPNGVSPPRVRLVDVDSEYANLQNAFVVTEPNGAEAAGGYYRVVHSGSPVERPFSAPPGSQYVDSESGSMWVKATGSGPSGWRRVQTTSTDSRD
jgi:Pectate lyase superfamily protein